MTIRTIIVIPIIAAVMAVTCLIYILLCLGYAVAGFVDWCRE